MNPNGHPKGLSIGLWLDDLRLGVRAGLQHVSAWGMEAAGLDAFGPEVRPRALSGTGRRDLAHRIRASGASVTLFRADLGGRRLGDPQSLDANLGRLREAFELARDAGGRAVVVPLGFVPPKDRVEDAVLRRTLAEALRALHAFGTDLGVRPAVPCGHAPAADLATLLMESDPGGLLEVDLNPGACVARGDDPAAILAALYARAGLATAVDHYRGGGEAPFGQGDVRWGEVIVGLSTCARGASLPILAACGRECDRPAALRHALNGLKKLRLHPMGG